MGGWLLFFLSMFALFLLEDSLYPTQRACGGERGSERSERDRRQREREGLDMEQMRRGSGKPTIERKWVTQKWACERICG